MEQEGRELILDEQQGGKLGRGEDAVIMLLTCVLQFTIVHLPPTSIGFNFIGKLENTEVTKREF